MTAGQGPAVRPTGGELAYLRSERRLARLATSDASGEPHVVPVGWSYDERRGTFEVSGRDLPATRKFRNVLANPRAALVVDDVLPPWQPRCVLVQGRAEAVPDDPAAGTAALIRITPTRIVSWGISTEDR